MINYSLPKTLEVNGKEYNIRWHTEAALDTITALSDPNLSDRDKALAVIGIIYEGVIPRKDQEEAIKQAYWFLDGGDVSKPKKSPRVIDWEKDFPLICAPVNRVLGYEIRADLQHLHWWTFIAAYMEVGGDCTFATVVRLREKIARGQKLEKYEQEFYNKNRELIDIRVKESKEEEAFLRDVFGL